MNKKSSKMRNFFQKFEKNFLAPGPGEQQLKFDRNPCIRYRDNCDIDSRISIL